MDKEEKNELLCEDMQRYYDCTIPGPPVMIVPEKPYTTSYPLKLKWKPPKGDYRSLMYTVAALVIGQKGKKAKRFYKPTK